MVHFYDLASRCISDFNAWWGKGRQSPQLVSILDLKQGVHGTTFVGVHIRLEGQPWKWPTILYRPGDKGGDTRNLRHRWEGRKALKPWNT